MKVAMASNVNVATMFSEHGFRRPGLEICLYRDRLIQRKGSIVGGKCSQCTCSVLESADALEDSAADWLLHFHALCNGYQ